MPTKSWSTVRKERTRRVSQRRRRVTQRIAEPLNSGSGPDPESDSDSLRANLRGFNQVPPVLSPATGMFRATIASDGMSIQYELTFSNLTTPALFAHIHFGHETDNGGIMAFLCGGGDKAACPGQGGTISGTIEAGDIMAIPSQGLAAGDLAGALRIIRSGLAYVNVHTPTFPDGEIRGQIRD